MFLSFSFYSEDEVGHCIIVLSTLINREPSLCAPLLPEILLTVTRVIRETQYSWELDSNIYVPQNSRSIAKQFIRCALHQLSGNIISWVKVRFEKNFYFSNRWWHTKHLCNINFSLSNIDRKWNIFNAIFDGTSRRAKDKILWNPCELFAGLYRAESRCASSIFFAGNIVLLIITSKISFYICSMF